MMKGRSHDPVVAQLLSHRDIVPQMHTRKDTIACCAEEAWKTTILLVHTDAEGESIKEKPTGKIHAS